MSSQPEYGSYAANNSLCSDANSQMTGIDRESDLCSTDLAQVIAQWMDERKDFVHTLNHS